MTYEFWFMLLLFIFSIADSIKIERLEERIEELEDAND